MQTVKIELGERSYPVFIGSGLLGKPHAGFETAYDGAVLVVSNETVAPLYMEALRSSLPVNDIHEVVIPDGESYKNVTYWSQIIDRLVDMRAARDATIITLGGGVVGDLGGFAAASYMRGIRFIQVPTTLLSQVDASVGGKTGFNHASGKNLVGAFHQPASVVIDIDTLQTLPAREFSAGLSEVVKIAAVRDENFLIWLEQNTNAIMSRRDDVLIETIRRSIENKASVVIEDERESGVRALLNFGHTFAHAFETLTGYQRYLHGEAVAIGMMTAARLSELRSLCTPGFTDRLGKLLQAFELPLDIPHDIHTGQVLDTMRLDKKVMAGSLRLILVKSAGQGFIDSSSGKIQIAAAIDASRPAS
jgi:3-dehydroquinate synthase